MRTQQRKLIITLIGLTIIGVLGFGLFVTVERFWKPQDSWDIQESKIGSTEPVKESAEIQNRYIVKFKDGVSENQKKAIIHKYGGEILLDLDIINAKTVSLPDKEKQSLEKEHTILRVNKEIILELHEVGQSAPDSPPETSPQANDSQVPTTRLAILDDGINPNDVTVAGGYNVINPEDDPYSSSSSHGTGVAGAAQETANEFRDEVNVEIYSVQVMNDATEGASESNIVQGIEWAIENNMDVINISAGSNTRAPAMREAIEKANDAGIPVVVSGGNCGMSSACADTYPAAYDETITVGGNVVISGQEDMLFAGTGENVDAMANGNYASADGTRTWVGTSIAAPRVAAVVAAIKEQPIPIEYDTDSDGQWDPDEIKQVVRDNIGLYQNNRDNNEPTPTTPLSEDNRLMLQAVTNYTASSYESQSGEWCLYNNTKTYKECGIASEADCADMVTMPNEKCVPAPLPGENWCIYFGNSIECGFISQYECELEADWTLPVGASCQQENLGTPTSPRSGTITTPTTPTTTSVNISQTPQNQNPGGGLIGVGTGGPSSRYTGNPSGSGPGGPIVSCSGLDCNVCHIFQTIVNLVEFMWYSLALPAAVIAFLYGGIMWTTAGDDPSKVTKGRRAIVSALVGLIIAFGAWLIVDAVMKTLAGGSISGWGVWNDWPGC